jgi:hypothetical protein
MNSQCLVAALKYILCNMFLGFMVSKMKPTVIFLNKIFFAGLLILSVQSTAVAEEYAVAGTAYDIKSGQLVYREVISKLDLNGEVHVSYVRSDGVIFARKTLNYATEVFQPGFTLEDDRDEEILKAEFDAGRLLLTHSAKGNSQTKTLYDTAALVIDLGLDAFIQQHWAELVAGKKINFDFVNSRQLSVEKWLVKSIGSEDSPLSYKGAMPNWKYFRVEPKRRLASLFAETIYFAYDPEGMFVMRYQGSAAVDSDKGEAFGVRIEYEYF